MKYHIEGWNEADGTEIDRIIEVQENQNSLRHGTWNPNFFDGLTSQKKVSQNRIDEIRNCMKEYYNIDPAGIIFGKVNKNNLLAQEKVFSGSLMRYVTYMSGKTHFVVVYTM